MRAWFVCSQEEAAPTSAVREMLEPAGREAEQILTLFWWMLGGAAAVWLAVTGVALYALLFQHESYSRREASWLIVGGGAVVPTLVLGTLAASGLSLLPDLLEPAPEGSLRIVVEGKQWWWRVRYEPPGRPPFELANEIRLPVGRPVQFELHSPDVIHAFWIPALGGKIDMIPGRSTRLKLRPTKTGQFRGVCAEYCGASHALMSFVAVVLTPEEFDAWIHAQTQPAQPVASPLADRGQALFLSNGCNACHAIRGTSAGGVVGPDLTHVGGRLSLGAGTLPNDEEGFRRWVAETATVKPGVHMPAFGMLPQEDRRALAAYLDGLE